MGVVVRDSPCRKALYPTQAIAATISVSLAIAFVDNVPFLLTTLTIVATLSTVLSPGKLVSVAKAVTPLATAYSLLAPLAQLIVLGHIDASSILINILRIAIVVILSISLISCIDISKLLELTYRLSPELGVSLALSIKMLKSLPRLWTFIYRLYKTNLPCSSYLDRVETLIISVKTFLFLVLYSSIQSVEAILTRSKIFRSTTQRRIV